MSEFVWLPSGMTDQRTISRPISVSIKYDFIFRSADHAGLMQSTMPLMTEARQQRCINFDDRRAIVIAERNQASMNLFIIASAGEILHVEGRDSLVIGDQHEDGFNDSDGLSNRISRYLLHRDARTGKGWPHYAPGILLPVI